MNCPACGHENPDSAKFCDECAAPFNRRCAACGSTNRPNAKFCNECAAPLTPGGSSRAGSGQQNSSAILVTPDLANTATALDGERKTVTALFADIKGSTELMEDLDPEEARAIIDPAFKLMIDAVQRYDGYVVQSTGDGIFALFGAPVAHEDHPQRALYAALRMQEELRRYSDRIRAGRSAYRSQARVGVNTGEVVVRSIATGGAKTEYTPIGHTDQSGVADADVGADRFDRRHRDYPQAVRRLLHARSRSARLESRAMSEPVNVYEVTGLGPLRTRLQRSAGRGLTKFVGREREMEAMRARRRSARPAGRGQIVAAMAEAGTGKSRLLFEFKAKHQSGWMVLETFSVSHGKASAYLPGARPACTAISELSADDDARTRREKVERQGSSRSTVRWKTRCHTCSVCSGSSRATIRWRRWTGR